MRLSQNQQAPVASRPFLTLSASKKLGTVALTIV
jgi:hypothetical protein